jgi:hypothetical protein
MRIVCGVVLHSTTLATNEFTGTSTGFDTALTFDDDRGRGHIAIVPVSLYNGNSALYDSDMTRMESRACEKEETCQERKYRSIKPDLLSP